MSFKEDLTSASKTPQQLEHEFDEYVECEFNSAITWHYNSIKSEIVDKAEKGVFTFSNGQKTITGFYPIRINHTLYDWHRGQSDSEYKKTHQLLVDAVKNHRYILKIGSLKFNSDYEDCLVMDTINCKELHRHEGHGFIIPTYEYKTTSIKVTQGKDTAIIFNKLNELCKNDGILLDPCIRVILISTKPPKNALQESFYQVQSFTVRLGLKKDACCEYGVRYTVTY